MAKRVDQDMVRHLAARSRTEYDWGQWADGGWWELEKGKDFHAGPSSVRTSARRWADNNDYQVSILAVEGKDNLFICFTRK